MTVDEPTTLSHALPKPVAFVFGGGGSLGSVQVGMLQAIGEHRVVPDLVVGTSVGSLNGAVVAQDPTSATNRLSHAWERIQRSDAFPGGLLAQARTLERSRTHLFPNTGVGRLIGEFLGAEVTFDQLALPFGAVATDVVTATAHVFDRGDLTPSLLASAAIPGIFPPVIRDGRKFFDGGIVANVPMKQALSMGAKSMVVFDCTFPGHLLPPPETLAETLLYTAMVTMRSQALNDAPVVAREIPVVYLPGPQANRISPFNFDHTATLIETAYDAARSFLGNLAFAGPGLYGSPTGG